MADHSGAALDVANAVLARMLADDGPSWTVLDTDLLETPHVLITVGSKPGASDLVSVYFNGRRPGG